MKEMYFTITGCNHYYGNEFMEKGMKVKLVKEPDNEYDKEAIQVKIKGLGKCSYVANSPYTVKGESMSAGRLYDKLGKKAKGRIVFVIGNGAICKITDSGLDVEDEFEMSGLDVDELEMTSADERHEELEDAGLDPDDYDFD